MRRALSFYRDILGLRVLHESDDWCTVDLAGIRIGLESTDGKPVPKVDGAGATLTLKSTDIRADVARLKAKGVKFRGEIRDYDWGSVVAFEDSEGNVLKLMEPPEE